MIGVVARENAAEQIKQYQKFTVNISDETSMLAMEQAGFISHQEKLERLGECIMKFLNELRFLF